MSKEIIDHGFGVIETRETFYTEETIRQKNQKIADLEAKLAEKESEVKVGEFWHSAYQGKQLDYDKVYAELRQSYDENEKLKQQLTEKEERIAELEDKDWYEGLIKQLEDQCGRLLEERDNAKLQLEESEAYIQGNIPKLIEANKMMSKQLTEKEEKIMELASKVDLLESEKENLFRTLEEANEDYQDKISFCIEQLEKVKNEIYANEVSFEEIAKLPIALNNYEIGFDKGRFKAVHIIDNQIKQLKEGK